MLGKGFSGIQLQDRPAATLAGTYLYGLTFAFGWTACVGPILGAVLTTLATTGVSVLAGATLAFVSDMTLLDTALLPHGKSIFSDIQVASLDHAMWFHRPFRADEWLLYAQDSPSASGARGFNRGALFTRDGLLVASVAQEGLIRPR